ncbi:hypothetical protein NM208_g2287 [Fusarium decemcellulare]|uniref:Uncharacterized protein n=1 Tax=Fusarium decemcellulare TaxID=57161 RepID=A0ACC1STB2_9HYPO|nr:hypothetical protein NM208_g2287 [Fusarium decemcellulare]
MPPDIFDSLIPAEEYHLRLDTIIQIRDEHRRRIADETRELTILEFCYLISMSLSDLQGLARIARISYVVVRHLFDHMVELTDRFFRDGPRIQNEGEKAKCLDFDNGVCIITGAPDPHVCRIVPFAGHEMAKYASIGVMDSSDKIWNMMCLSPLLHDWWARGYFALKFHGENPNDDGTSSIQLQFFWIPSYIRRGTAMDPINLEQQRDSHTRLAAFLTYPHGENSPTCSPEHSCLMCAEAKQVANHRPVSTGAILQLLGPRPMYRISGV